MQAAATILLGTLGSMALMMSSVAHGGFLDDLKGAMTSVVKQAVGAAPEGSTDSNRNVAQHLPQPVRPPSEPATSGAAPASDNSNAVMAASQDEFSAVAEPDVLTLLPLLFKSRPDEYRSDDFALGYEALHTQTQSYRHCPHALASRMNDFDRARYMSGVKARLSAAVEDGKSAPESMVVRLMDWTKLEDYDFNRNGFFIWTKPMLIDGTKGGGRVFSVIPKISQVCKQTPWLEIHLDGVKWADFIPMAPNKAEKLVEQIGSQRRIQLEGLVRVRDSGRANALRGELTALRAIEPATGTVIYTWPTRESF